MSQLLSTESFLLTVILSLAISLFAWRLKLLTLSGGISAFGVGFCIFGYGGYAWALILLLFFLSSSILSKIYSPRKEHISEKFAKGSQRDWEQVFANGALGSLLAIIFRFSGENAGFWLAFCGAMATVTADTWATELGVLNPKPPRRISDGKIVETGDSGGVSLYGTLAALCGSLLISIAAWLFSPVILAPSWILIITVAGVCGAMVDSLLGATWQAFYFCPDCLKETERYPVHRCGGQTRLIRGHSWLNNDWVNFLSSLAGSIFSISLWIIL